MSRIDRKNRSAGIRPADDLGHDEGRRPHHRRHDLTAGGDDRLDRTGLMGKIALPLHHRDGQGAGDGDVAGGRPGDHPEQCGKDDRGLGRCRPHRPGEAVRQSEEEVPRAEHGQKRSEYREHHDVGGRDTERDSVDPFRRRRQERGDPFDAVASAMKQPRQIGANERIDEEDERDQRQRQTDPPPCALENQKDDGETDPGVEGRRHAAGERDRLPARQQVGAAADRGGDEQRSERGIEPCSYPAGSDILRGEGRSGGIEQHQHGTEVHETDLHRRQHEDAADIEQVEDAQSDGDPSDCRGVRTQERRPHRRPRCRR